MIKKDSAFGVDRLVKITELVGKTAIGLLATCYVIGILVVNVYLSNYGIHSLSLFRLIYVTAGVWAIFPIFMGLVLVYSAFIFLFKLRPSHLIIRGLFRPQKPKDDSPTQLLSWSALVVFIIISAFLTLLTFWAIRLPFRSEWLLFLFGGIVVAFLSIFLVLIPQEKSLEDYFHYSLLFILVALMLTAYVATFSRYGYGLIPYHIGGGSPQTVHFNVAADVELRTFLQEAGISFEGESYRTEGVTLLFTTDDEYILLVSKPDSNKQRAISLRRDNIKAILYTDGY